MKNLFAIILISLAASGCALFQTSNFDPIEYSNFVDVMTNAEKVNEMCGSTTHPNLLFVTNQLEARAHFLENYTSHRLRNENTIEIAETIHDTTEELVERYENGPVSTVYCKTKTLLIATQAKQGADAVQKKVRR